jgi:hypothetical protein
MTAPNTQTTADASAGTKWVTLGKTITHKGRPYGPGRVQVPASFPDKWDRSRSGATTDQTTDADLRAAARDAAGGELDALARMLRQRGLVVEASSADGTLTALDVMRALEAPRPADGEDGENAEPPSSTPPTSTSPATPSGSAPRDLTGGAPITGGAAAATEANAAANAAASTAGTASTPGTPTPPSDGGATSRRSGGSGGAGSAGA